MHLGTDGLFSVRQKRQKIRRSNNKVAGEMMQCNESLQYKHNITSNDLSPPLEMGNEVSLSGQISSTHFGFEAYRRE